MNDWTFEDTSSPQTNSDLVELDIWETSPPDEILPPLEGDLLESDGLREIGNPQDLAPYWRYQGDTMDCALYAQGGILEANGQPLDINAYREQGESEGWYAPDRGTDIPAIGQLVEENGIPVKHYDYGATPADLAHELSQGHGVIVAVDTEPIWGEPGGHALWVTGMEINPDGSPASVICNDSGHPDGQGIVYPFEEFSSAWDWQNNFMVATREPLAATER